MTKVVYHRTAVVSFDSERIILNSGGYHTATTKLRMNQAENQFQLGFSVYQDDFDWFVNLTGLGPGHKVPYKDGMEISRTPAEPLCKG